MTEQIRIIIHAGFHKTGTTTLQSFLKQNRKIFDPETRVYLGREYGSLAFRGRKYGFDPSPRQLHMFGKTTRAFVDELPQQGVVVLTRESFAGMMVGSMRSDDTWIRSYEDSAVPLAVKLYEHIRDRFGENARIEFLYTLRAYGAFLKSCYGHHLRAWRITDDYKAFFARMDFDRTLQKEYEAIRMAIPGAQFHCQWLEDAADYRFGPAEKLVQLLELPETVLGRLKPVSAERTGQDENLSDKLLWLNRNVDCDNELKEQKAKVLAQAES